MLPMLVSPSFLIFHQGLSLRHTSLSISEASPPNGSQGLPQDRLCRRCFCCCSFNIFTFTFVYVHVHTCVHMCAHANHSEWVKSELARVLSSSFVGSRIQVVRPDGKPLNLLSHLYLAVPRTCFYTIVFGLQDSPRA